MSDSVDKPLIDRQKALNRLQSLCAKMEKCSGDIRKKLLVWRLPEPDVEYVLQQLVADGFVDDRRFARAYVRSKANYSGWGARKIRTSLRAKGLPDDIVDDALQQITPDKSLATLRELLTRKLHSINAKSTYELQSKLIRFGASRGFDLDLVIALARELVKDLE